MEWQSGNNGKRVIKRVNELLRVHDFPAMITLIDRSVGDRSLSVVDRADLFGLRGIACYFNQDYGSAESDYLSAIELVPDHLEVLLCLVHLLACCPESTLHSPGMAIDFGRKACAIVASRDWRCLNELGASFARDGNFRNALTVTGWARLMVPSDFAWRVQHFEECFQNDQPYTASLKDDLRYLDQQMSL